MVWRLAAEGFDVVFSGRDIARAREITALAPREVQFVHIQHGSPEAANEMRSATQHCDAIIHCAALSAPWGPRPDFERANIKSTREVLASCRENDIEKLVHISTPGIYFNFSDRLNIREDAMLPRPANDYVDTKRWAEQLVQTDSPRHTVILRPRAIFGPWDTTLMPRLVRAIHRGPIPLLRGGRALLDLTYVDNAVDAVWLALTQKTPEKPVIYNVCNEEPIAVEDLLRQVSFACGLPLKLRAMPYPVVDVVARLAECRARMFGGREPVLTRYTAGLLAFSQTLCLDAIRRDLGFSPRVSLSEGIRRYADWMKKAGKS